MNGFTGNEQKILKALSDGKPHLRDDLLLALDPDGLASPNRLRAVVSGMRKKLRSKEETIVCEFANRRVFYRHVRLITSGE